MLNRFLFNLSDDPPFVSPPPFPIKVGRLLGFALCLFGWLFLPSCEKTPELDADGGYFNEKTGKYKYVRIGRKTVADDPQGLSKPKDGLIQQVAGKIVGVESPDSILLEIPQRQTYMILTQDIQPSMKDERLKRVRIYLKHVNPMLNSFATGSFRKKWREFATSRMERQLLNKEAVVTFNFESKTNSLFGVVATNSPTVAGVDSLRNINLWMIEEGLSHYIFDSDNLSSIHETYLKAERRAVAEKKGIWRY